MKKIFSFLFFVVFAGSLSAAQYYVSGNGSAGSPWCNGLSWGATACKMTMNAAGTEGTITFANVPVGSYQFKVTNGSSWYGISKFNADCSNLYAYGSDNICFSISTLQDITISYDGSKICLTGSVGNDYPDTTLYNKVGVPAECEDVMLQAFYWNSCNKTTYGGATTKWVPLMRDTLDICRDFDLVWFPPATGGDGVGYYPKSYSFKQSSAWGTKENLKKLIKALNNGGTKALADIVINHRSSTSGWAKGFGTDDFGAYGQFTLNSTHICSNDEAKTSTSSDSQSLTYGNPDTGNGDSGCRDLDHTSPYVQEMCKAYTRYMIDSIGFSGFRYDMVIGYLGTYLSEYNLASQPYISVGEYWSDLSSTKNYLATAMYNTMVFDFPLKYALKSAVNNQSFSGLKSASNSLRGQGLSKYAVTFVDNHDTYERDNSDYLVKDIRAAGAGDKVLMANAYILMMPGVPCVFYPHWITFKTDISSMIALRKEAGIHSESQVTDEAASTKSYTATIHGHHGNVILRMGENRDTQLPAGYVHKLTGRNFDIYLSADCVSNSDCVTVGVENVALTESAEKEVVNGQVIIRKNGLRYDVLGRIIK